jgi:hypothetical protein
MRFRIEPRHEVWLQQEWEPTIQGWSQDIAPFYAALAEWLPDGARLLELGVNEGRSILFYAQQRRAFGRLANAIGVDPMGEDKRSVFRQHRARLGLVDDVALVSTWSAEYSLAVPPHRFGAVFIDGGHEYPSVREDILAYQDKVSTAGIMAGHDYDNPEHPGVKRAVDELLGDRVGHYHSVWWRL